MKKIRILLHLLIFTALPLRSMEIVEPGITFRDPFFENARVIRGNADAVGDIVLRRTDSALNEPNIHTKRIWEDVGYANHHQASMHGLGYNADTFFVGTGIDYRCSSLLSFLDRCVIGLFAFYADTSMSYGGSESLRGDKSEHDSFFFGFYSGYATGRWTIFSTSRFGVTKYRDSLSVHSGVDQSGPLASVGSHTFRGKSSHSNIGISYKIPHKHLTIEPMVFMNYETITQRAHNSGAVSVSKQDVKYLQMTFGVKAWTSAKIGSRLLRPYIFAGLARDVHKRNGASEASHIYSNGERDFLAAGAGLSASINDSMSVNLSYRGNYSRRVKISAVAVEMSHKF